MQKPLFPLEVPQIHPFKLIPTTSQPHCVSINKLEVFHEKYWIAKWGKKITGAKIYFPFAFSSQIV